MGKRVSRGDWQKVLALAVGVLLSVVVTGNDKAHSAPDIEMVFVKGGCFQMGDTFGVGKPDEKPVHEVCVDDFYIGKYEVTQRQWEAVMGTNPPRACIKDCGYNCPMDCVSWDDVQEFIVKFSEMTGKKYRLPTEAEWEYVARSGGKKEKWAGTNDENELGEYAWYVKNSGNKIHVVGMKRPNGLGIYDMSGNVSEWCQDRYGDLYYEESPRDNPQGPKTGDARVLRGGTWIDDPSDVRASLRNRTNPSWRYYDVGFRLALPSQ